MYDKAIQLNLQDSDVYIINKGLKYIYDIGLSQ